MALSSRVIHCRPRRDRLPHRRCSYSCRARCRPVRGAGEARDELLQVANELAQLAAALPEGKAEA